MALDSEDSAAERSLHRGVFRRSSAEFDRGISFYDAIYGFSATLLVANIDAPPPAAWHDIASLAATGVGGQLVGFALSFVVIVVFWRVNVRFVRRIAAMDAVTTTMNLVAAGLVILIPFTTQGMSDPSSVSYALPTVIYAVNIALASLAQLAMLEVAHARGLLTAPMTRRENAILLLDVLPTPVVFALSIPVTLALGGEAGKLSWLSLLVIGPLTGALARRAAGVSARARAGR